MIRNIHLLLIVSTLSIHTMAARGGDTVIIHNIAETDSIALLDHASYFVDKTNNLQWPEITNQNFVYTNPSPWKKENYGERQTSLWLKCTIKNTSSDSIPLILIVHRFAFYKQVIQVRKNNTIIYRPAYFFNPQTKVKRKNVRIPMGGGEELTLFIQVGDPLANLFQDNLYFTNMPAYEQTIKDLYYGDYTYYVFKLIFLSIIAFITLHTVIQYFIRRRSEFIYYALYSFSVFLFFIRQTEMSLSYDFLFSFFPYVYKYCNNPVSILVYYTYFRFARQFVDFKTLAPWFYRVIIFTERLLAFMFVADVFCSLSDYFRLQHMLFAALRTLLLVISFVGIFLLLKSGKTLLYFFGIGSLFLIIGSLLSMIYSFYPDQAPIFSDDPLRFMQIGIVLELLCFTSGLSYKSNLIEVEKRQTQLQLIQQLEENHRLQEELNTGLEERVREQTEQILIQQKQLEKEKELQLTIEFKKKLTEMELQVLKAQLNPHFYFNTLNNLYGLTLIDPKKAPDAILKLSDIMEYVIYDCKSEKVALDKELKFISSYIDLERLRYEHNTRIFVSLHGNSEGKIISPLLLIQFVENAFKHGMEQNKNNSYLHVDITVHNNSLLFHSINSKKLESNKPHGLGLSNVQKRLQMLYPNRHKLEIDDNGSEFRVTLQMELS